MLPFDDPRLTVPSDGSQLSLQVRAGVAAIRRNPEPDGEQVSQLVHGETVRLHHEEGEFGLIQSDLDRYVGWVLMEALAAPVLPTTHRVTVPRLHVYSEPSIKAAPYFVIGIGARLAATGDREGRYIRCDGAGWVLEDLITPMTPFAPDPASVAERFLTTPYLWGGRDCLGVDCSGLIQLSLGACGIASPRDSDMQFNWLGHSIEDWTEPRALRRNDLIFWKGHVGMMLDPDTLLHANAYHMAVAQEPLALAIERISKTYGEPIGARRLNVSDMVGRVPDWLTPR